MIGRVLLRIWPVIDSINKMYQIFPRKGTSKGIGPAKTPYRYGEPTCAVTVCLYFQVAPQASPVGSNLGNKLHETSISSGRAGGTMFKALKEALLREVLEKVGAELAQLICE